MKVQVDERVAVSAVVDAPAGASTCVVLGHGAGNDMHAPLLAHLHGMLAGNGIAVARFNFPYKEAGRGAPDGQPRLLATWRAVIAALRARLAPERLFVGGKSMGGRMASLLVAQGEAVDGLVFLGYPLHPAGKPERLRDGHFDAIGCDCLFVQGERDPLCDLSLLKTSLRRLRGDVTLHVVAGGDHSFKVPKSAGRDADAVQAEIDAVLLDWFRSR